MNKIGPELEGVSTVAIGGHVRPDGDCVGSCLGMYQYLTENFSQLTEVTVYLEEISENYHFLKGADKVCNSCEEEKVYDLFIALDSGDIKRLGGAQKYFETARKTICIDHHVSNIGYAQVNHIVPEASSTSELIYDVIDQDKITKEIAEALYMGIAHDTGVFQYSCTSPKTMRTVAALMEKEIPFSRILDETFNYKTYIQKQILGRALLESMMLIEGKCIVSVIRQKELDFYNVKPSDLSGIVSQLRTTTGVEVAIFLYESNVQEYRVSMRSNGKVDVNKVASYFGGGGHVLAAGCTMQGSMHDVVNNLTMHIARQLDAFDSKEDEAQPGEQK